MNSTLITSIALNMTQAGTSSSSSVNQAQFKHTLLWNNTVANLKKKLIEQSTGPSSTQAKLRKQHSRFVAASVGGMLNLKQNIILNTTNTFNNLTSHAHNSGSANPANKSIWLTKASTHNDDIYFTGAQCVDIVYQYLIGSEHSHKFERQVTKEKCVKVCKVAFYFT